MHNKYQKYGLVAVLAMIAIVGIYLVDAQFFSHALAAGGTDVFDKGADKGNEIAEQLKGKIAVTITGLVIGVTAILMQLGRVNHMIGVRIIMGTLIVGSCMGIAEFLYA